MSGAMTYLLTYVPYAVSMGLCIFRDKRVIVRCPCTEEAKEVEFSTVIERKKRDSSVWSNGN